MTLENCPWCNAPGTFCKEPAWHVDRTGMTYGYFNHYIYYIQCSSPKCLAEAPNGRFEDISETPEQARSQAINVWNSRPGKQEQNICDGYHIEYGKTVCYCTKEREECTCGGNKRECNFYDPEL